MSEQEILARLKTLVNDVNSDDTEAKKCIQEYCDATEEKDNIIKDQYAEENAPVATASADEFSSSDKSNQGFFDQYVLGYDEYLTNMLKEYNSLMKRKIEARKLMTMVMMLPFKLSRVIYLAYIRQVPVEDLCNDLYMSRSTYYRYRSVALKILAKNYDPEN